MLFARRNFDASRRPIDHKKLLDMLIDDVEGQVHRSARGDAFAYREHRRLHQGHRDGVLDNDFNTQFYYPAFAEIRRASRYYDVTLGIVETTTVLANNRGFATVEPSATMEFDLPSAIS